MITIKYYVDKLFEDVPNSTEKLSIIQELVQNLEEKVQDLVDDGKSEEDAINKAIVEFGDASEIKNDLMMSAPQMTTSNKNNINYVNRFWYSVFGSGLLIGLFVFINLYYSPNSIWYVYPTFAILWWPLSMFFSWLNNKQK